MKTLKGNKVGETVVEAGTRGEPRGAGGGKKGRERERSKTRGVMSRSEMPPSLSHISTILITLHNASE